MMKRIALVILFGSSLLGDLKASHLVGGDLGYEYIGETAPGSGQFRYKLKLRLYVNCGSDSNFPSILDVLGSTTTPLLVGVYAEDALNPDAQKNLVVTGNVFLQTYNIITPPLPDNCILGVGQCLEESLLEGEVILAASTSGYHLYFESFARNAAILNLLNPGATGIGFYSFIPPTAIVNSSPVFIGTPVPFICITDTTTFANSAQDIDGDSLVFSFETPYASQDNSGGILPPPNPLNWPIANVTWQAGYNSAQPFGAGGYAFINPLTGAAEYAAVSIGNWVVAVEVKEYRNGQLIGRIRSDLQLLSTPCTNNIAPIPAGGSMITAYQVTAGDTLCFPLAFTDANGDTLSLSSNGAIFDGGLFNPPAAITGALIGDSLLGSQFCWPTICSEGQDQPYLFSLLISDDACPPGIYSVVISVEVIPIGGLQAIEGPLVACSGQTSQYCFGNTVGASYAWTVTGGTLLSAADGHCITVAWDTPGNGSLTVHSTSNTCTWDDQVSIIINPQPQASFVLDMDTTCIGLKATVVEVLPAGGSQIWQVNGYETPVLGTPSGSIPLAFGSSSYVSLIYTDVFGCIDTVAQTYTVGTYTDAVKFSIPNVFTPNGDGLNDRFNLISNAEIGECLTMRIFDRWGNVAYESTTGSVGWNGNHESGGQAAIGVYYYILSVRDEEFHGYLTLLR